MIRRWAIWDSLTLEWRGQSSNKIPCFLCSYLNMIPKLILLRITWMLYKNKNHGKILIPIEKGCFWFQVPTLRLPKDFHLISLFKMVLSHIEKLYTVLFTVIRNLYVGKSMYMGTAHRCVQKSSSWMKNCYS